MSFFGSHEDAVKWGTAATKVIDGETFSSPIRDGSSTVEAGGISWDHGVPHFDNHEQHGRPILAQGHTGGPRRMYGQEKKTSYK